MSLFFAFIAGLLMLILLIIGKIKIFSAQKQISKLIADLKETGEKIQVDFSKCEIKENNYTEERNKYENNERVQFLNVMSGYADKNIEQVEITQTVIVYVHQNVRTGQTERFISGIIPKDKITLSFYLEQQKQTAIYVDRTNKRYYFDLEFLS
jgi:hypothetical protein